MTWQDDDQIWDNLDELMMNGYSDMKNFLDSIAEYKVELGHLNRAILFGVFGQFCVSYVESRNETNSPQHSLANAFFNLDNVKLIILYNYKIIYRNEEIMVAINKKYMKDEEE